MHILAFKARESNEDSSMAVRNRRAATMVTPRYWRREVCQESADRHDCRSNYKYYVVAARSQCTGRMIDLKSETWIDRVDNGSLNTETVIGSHLCGD
jgi:hypothetical protein